MGTLTFSAGAFVLNPSPSLSTNPADDQPRPPARLLSPVRPGASPRSGPGLPDGLSDAEAVHLLRATGRLIARLYGPPAAVVGVARSGTAYAEVVARASAAAGLVVVGVSRKTSRGYRGALRHRIDDLVPLGLRRLYKASLYPLAIRASARQPECRQIEGVEREALVEVLRPAPTGPVVVVDDSIDTGKTVDLVRQQVQELAPDTPVVVVALNSTVGAICGDHQLTLVHGAHLETIDGDPSSLHTDGPPIRFAERSLAPDPGAADPELRLYLDLDHTLCRGNTFTMAVAELLRLALRHPTEPANLGLILAAAIRRSRLAGHRWFKQRVDRRIRSLPVDQRHRFEQGLLARIRADVRPALLAVARSPRVEAAIVTAALTSYRSVIDEAFGLPVLTGAGPQPDGSWAEPGALDKCAAIEHDLGGDDPGLGLMIGDSLVDLLSARQVPATTVIDGDTSGLATILAATGWWAAERPGGTRS